jgi:hypothetical protein
MKEYLKTGILKYFSFILVSSVIIGCNESVVEKKVVYVEVKPAGKISNAVHEEIAVAPPPFTEGIFPCNDCHKFQKPNPLRRTLTWHEDITEIFNHDSQNRWCLDCHDLRQRDSLRLASGQLLDFKESYKLCGQCHGDKLRDWKVGVHGRRTGYWNGKKQYFLCVSCHNPHSPRFKQVKPESPPFREIETIK